MNQHKTLLQLCQMTCAPRNAQCKPITGTAWCASTDDDPRRAVRVTRALQHTTARALLRDPAKGLLRQVEAAPVNQITEEAILHLWQSIPKERQANAVFLMNGATLDTLCTTLQDGPYALLSRTEQGFRLMNKPIVLDTNMPCIEPGKEPILYGDFSQVQITDQGTGKLQARKDPAHPGMEECSMNAYMDVKLMDRQAVKGVKIKA